MESFVFTRKAVRQLKARRTRAVAVNMAIVIAASLLISSPLALAQDQTLSGAEIAAIQLAVATALADIDPNLTGQARTAAVSHALAQVATTQIAADGPSAIAQVVSAAIAANIPAPQAIQALLPASITAGVPPATAISAITVAAVSAGASPSVTAEAVIAVAAQTATPAATVGSGLGQAAAILSQGSNNGAANQVAQVVANQGTTGTRQSFGTTVVATGGSQQLATAAQQTPALTSVTGSTAAPTLAVTANATGSAQSGISQFTSAGLAVTCTNPSCN